MTLRSKIAVATLGLLIATGAASAQTRATVPATGTTVQATAPSKTALQAVKVAHKQHRLNVTHRKVKHAKIAHRSIRAKIAHKLGLKPTAKQHIAKARIVGARKHA